MGDNLTFWQRLGLNLADHIPDTKFFKDRAYNIIASPKVGMQAGATKKDIFDLAFKTPDREDTNKYMFIYGADTRRPETNIGNAYDWQSDIDENNYTDVKSYEGILNPYNEYLIDSRNKGLIEELAKVGYTPTVNINDEYSDPNTHRLNPETPYFDDVHSYRPRFHMKDGKPVISASDLYDFGKNYTEGFQGIAEERSDSQINPYMLEFQRRALNSVGKPYRLVQKNIPIRFVDNPQGNEINRVNNFTNQVINNLSDEDIAIITGTGYIEPAIVYYKKGSNIHIKKKNHGKFTEYCGGKVTEECIRKGKNSSDPAVRKRATFAANARKWKHENGGTIKIINNMIPDIIKFFNGGGIPMFQNSGQLGSFYKTDWKRKTSYQTETSQDRGGGIRQKDYGEILTDENGIPYRDVRTRYSGIRSENPVDISFEREYDTNSRMYKKAVKRGWRNPGIMMATNDWTSGYTPEQVDSLTTHFDKLYGTPVVK